MYGAVFSREYYLSKFVESITVSRPMSGEVLYYSNKLSEANLSTSVTLGEIRAGVGNPIIGIIPSDSNLTVEITDQNLDLAIRAYQAGGLHGYGAPTRVCQDVIPSGADLTIDTTVYGAPVAGQGMTEPLCYVQIVGQESTIQSDGVPYQISSSGQVLGFSVIDASLTYKVWYWANLPTTEYTTILANMDPSVVSVRFVYPVYSNLKEDGTGTRVGSLEVVVPFMKFGGNAGINGNGSSNVNTTISGTAIAFQNPVVEAGCGACTDASAALAHYLYIPCSGADSIQGLFYLGGYVEVVTNSTKQLEFMLMVNGNPVKPDNALMSYQAVGAPTGTSVSSGGLITAGETEGEFEIVGTYEINGTQWTCPINASVDDAK